MANSRNSVRSSLLAAGPDPGRSYRSQVAACEKKFRARNPRVRRFGSTEPRVCTPPLRALTPETSAGFACIEFAEDVLGIELLPWQQALLIRALELLDDGTFRFRTVLVLVARQNGKSTLAQVLALFFMYVRGAGLVIGTAQNIDIAKEVWQGAVDIAQDVPELAELIKGQPRTTNGQISLELVTGERYKVQAASRRGGRGLSGDLVLLDELREHQSWDAWGAVTKTTLARPFAQIWALSNAGDATSVVLRHLRKKAHEPLGDPDGLSRTIGDLPDPTEVEVDPESLAEADESLGIFEWSALPDCDTSDRDGWAMGNPSLGYVLPERALASAHATDPEWVFKTECMCQWSDGALEGPFPPGAWEAGTDPLSEIPADAPVVFGVDVSHDRSRAHVAVAGQRADGGWHVEVVASRVGLEWVKGWFAERASRSPMTVAAQGRGAPVASLLDDLRAIEGLTLVDCVGSEIGIGCGRFWDGVAAHVMSGDGPRAPRIWHRPQPVVDVAAATAVTHPLGDGAWGWDRTKSPVDPSPLVAETMALWLASRPTPPPAVSVYEDADLMIV